MRTNFSDPLRAGLRMACAVVGAALLAAPSLVLAHTGIDGAAHHGDATAATFLDGFLHPLTGIDHLFAMLALGVWSGTSARRVWAAPAAFVAMMLVGALLTSAGVRLPAVEPMIAASLLVIGLLAVTAARLPTVLAVGIAGVFALFHGASHGLQFAGWDGALGLSGVIAASALLHVAGVAIGRAGRSASNAQRSAHIRQVTGRGASWVPRATGSVAIVVGAGMLAMQYAVA